MVDPPTHAVAHVRTPRLAVVGLPDPVTVHSGERFRGQDAVVATHPVAEVHEEQGAIGTGRGVGPSLQVRVVGRHERRRIAVEGRRVGEGRRLELGEGVVEGQHVQAAGLHVGLVDQLCPRPAGGHLGDRSRDLPLTTSVSELGVRGDNVSIVIGRVEDGLSTVLQVADREELAEIRPVGRIRKQTDETGAVGYELGRRDVGIAGAPRHDLGHRGVDIKQTHIMEAHQNTGHDHLGG